MQMEMETEFHLKKLRLREFCKNLCSEAAPPPAKLQRHRLWHRHSFTAENLFIFSFLFFPFLLFLFYFSLYLLFFFISPFFIFLFFTFFFFTLFCFLLFFTCAPWNSLQWFVGTTSNNTWVILQITSMGLCICTYYIIVHLTFIYKYIIFMTFNTRPIHL